MLEAILPIGVSVASDTRDIPDAILFPEEEAQVARAIEARRREFATARACARNALARLGLPPKAIPAKARGAPRWPAGIVGSITHCDGYRGCAVARAEQFVSIGVDAEPDRPLPDGLLFDIAVPQEQAEMRDLMRHAPQVRWDRLLFCMKEAVYKVWSPLTERRLDFEDAVISVNPSSGTFAAHLRVPGPEIGSEAASELSGRWLSRDGILLSAIALPAPDTAFGEMAR